MSQDKQDIKVSIVMPTFNRAGYIMQTIDSILQQTYSNWELIIVDDGSTDNTAALVATVSDPRIRFHLAGRIAINGKIKNTGIQQSTGELVAFIDSDDLWAASKLEKQVAVFHKFPKAGFSLTGGYNFREMHVPLEFFYRQKDSVWCGNGFVAFFKSEVAAFTQSLLIRKSCLDKTGLFDETKPFADPEFILALAWHFPMVILYEPLLYRRLHNENHSSREWINNYQQTAKLIKSYRSQNMLPVSIAKDALFRMYINYGEDSLRHKQRRKALSVFLKSWQYRPFSLIPIKKMGKVIIGKG